MKFIILGLPKCGKTLLVDTLNRLDGFEVYGEIFVTRSPSPNMPPHPMKLINDHRKRDTAHNLHTWWHKKFATEIEEIPDITLLIRPRDVDEYFDEFYNSEYHKGFKLHQHHIESVPSILNYIKRNPDIKILHCNRKNKVKQALAAIGNRERGEKFKAGGKGTLGVIEDYKKRTEDLQNWFRYGPNPYHEIFYEDMTGDTNVDRVNLAPIKRFFGIDMPDEAPVLTRKNTQNKVSENLLNYQEFKDFFRTTEYYNMID